MTVDKIKDRIRKLLALAANNPSAEEAAAAYAQASRFALKYQLDLEELGSPLEADDAPELPTLSDVVRRVVHEAKRMSTWRGIVLNALAKANLCRAYNSCGSLTVFGVEKNVATVAYLFDAVCSQIDEKAKEALRRYDGPRGRTFGNSFRMGAATAVAQRIQIDPARAVDEAAEEAKAIGGNALVRVQRAREYVEANTAVLQKYASVVLNLGRAKKTRYRHDHDAYVAGRAAGQTVTLGGSRPALKS